MAPYSKKVSAKYDGKNLILSEPLDVPLGETVSVVVSSVAESTQAELDREIAERVRAFRENIGGSKLPPLPDEAFRRDENMYPDRW